MPDGDYAGFIDRYLEADNASDRLPGAGQIVDSNGRVIGRHEGIHRYTIGQRRGIGIADERPLYVISIDADRNRVTVGSSEELLSNEFTAAGVMERTTIHRTGERGSPRSLPPPLRRRHQPVANSRAQRFRRTHAPSRRYKHRFLSWWEVVCVVGSLD